MINFLKCDARAVIKLELDLSYQNKNKIEHEVIPVDNNTVYKITVADNDMGIYTIIGRIISFTMSPVKESMCYVSESTKPFCVDTITLDCSDEGKSSVKTINIFDIRSVKELQTEGFEELHRDTIPTFK